jgi:hypothetical protein
VGLSEVDVADLELVGLVQKGDAWKAYAYSPGRNLVALATEEKLRDASVTAVSSTGVALTTDAGNVVNLALRP